MLHPSFGVTLAEIKSRVKGNVTITANSTVVLGGEAVLDSVNVDGFARLEGNGVFKVDVK